MIQKLFISLLYRFKGFRKFYFSKSAHIFLFHRVLPQNKRDEWGINKSLAITPEALEELIIKLKSWGYEFVSHDDLLRGCKGGKKQMIHFTFDDGYLDNLTHGLPVLEKHNVPVTIYITNCFPNKSAVYWWYDLENLVEKKSAILLSKVEGTDVEVKDKSKTFHYVRPIIKNKPYGFHKDFSEKVGLVSADNRLALNDELNLTWEQIIELDKHPLIEIAAHTNSHVSVGQINKDEAIREIKEGWLELEQKLERKVNYFAYPYGGMEDTNKDLEPVLEGLGCKAAVLNYAGSVFKESLDSPLYIPRFGWTDEKSEVDLIDFLSSKKHLNNFGLKKRVS